jgi:hypothetical protein
MKSWTKLPLELVEEIFSFIDEKDHYTLAQCQLTCRRWSKLAEKYLCKFVDLDVHMDKYKKDIPAHAKYRATLTKKLEYGICNVYMMDYFLRSKTIPTIFPNVEYLSGTEGDKEWWDYLKSVKASGKWQALKQIPRCNMPKPIEYSEVALSYCNTLESVQLHFYSGNSRRPNYSQEFQTLIQNLDKFTRLEQLEIEYDPDYGYGKYEDSDDEDEDGERLVKARDNMDFDALVESCSSSLRSICLLVDTDYIAPERTLPNLISYGSNITTIKQRLRIHRFKGKDFLYEEEAVHYFMHKFPNLRTLIIDRLWSRLKLSEEVLNNFFQYLIKTPKFKVDGCFIDSRDYADKILATFMNNAAGDNKTFTFLFIYYDVELHFIGSPNMEDYIEFRTYKDKILFTNWASKKTSYYIQVGYENLLEYKIRHTAILQHYGSKIKQLRLNSNQLFNQDVYHTNSVKKNSGDTKSDRAVAASIDQILQHCTELETLSLEYTVFSTCSENKVINPSITSLDIHLCYLYYDTVLPQLSVRLPNLKNLSFMDTTFTHENEIECKNFVRINMPHTTFYSITWKTTSLEGDENPYDSFILKVTTTTDKRRGSRYFRGDASQLMVDKLTARQFTTLSKNNRYIAFDIICKGINHFSTTLDTAEQKQCVELA